MNISDLLQKLNRLKDKDEHSAQMVEDMINRLLEVAEPAPCHDDILITMNIIYDDGEVQFITMGRDSRYSYCELEYKSDWYSYEDKPLEEFKEFITKIFKICDDKQKSILFIRDNNTFIKDLCEFRMKSAGHIDKIPIRISFDGKMDKKDIIKYLDDRAKEWENNISGIEKFKPFVNELWEMGTDENRL